MENQTLCTACYCPMMHVSSRIPIQERVIKTVLNMRFRFVQCVTPFLIPLVRPAADEHEVKRGPPKPAPYPIEPGDWVEVKSEAEIAGTLSKSLRTRGLYFMPEMKKFQGKRFKVMKKVDRILMEATGELRKMNSPVLYLEGAYCDGSAHYDCQKTCFCMWREEWLRKVED